ncbi:MAG: APC family permease [Oscillospiraceae bacterium]
MENSEAIGNTSQVGLWKTILFTICGIIALDSFIAPTIIGVSCITIWIIAAVVFFIPYGLINAELGSTYPDDGGLYSWVHRAFGEGPAVMSGWFYWVNVSFWMPAVFVAFATWFSYAFAPSANMWVLAAIATAMCWLVVYIGIRGVELSVVVTNIAAIAKVAVLLIFGALGLIYGIQHGFANDFSLASFIPSYDHTTQYITVIIYNFMGFELISSIGSKIDNPGKNIPKMTIMAGIIITALYIFGSLGILAAVPAGEIDTVDGFFYTMEEICSVFGPAQRPMFLIIISIAMLTLVSNMVSWAMGANEVFAAAELDKRSKLLAHRSKKHGTPDALYIIMGVISTLLIILNFALSGDANDIFWTLLSFSMLVFLMTYLFIFPAAYKLRLKDPNTPRPYKIPGGNFGMLICVVLCEFFILLAIFFMFKDAGTGLGLWTLIIGTVLTLLSGFWLYAVGKKKKPENK